METYIYMYMFQAYKIFMGESNTNAKSKVR